MYQLYPSWRKGCSLNTSHYAEFQTFCCTHMEDEGMRLETQRRIDLKIRQVKLERNQLLSVSRLPNEVLGAIFVHASGTGIEDANPAVRFNFSFVCRHWREVAISTPKVWSHLPNGYLDWCRIMLERSKATDLTIEVDIDHRTRTRHGTVYLASRQVTLLQEALSGHGSRTEKLAIFCNVDPIILEILETLSVSAPRLRDLRLTFPPAMSCSTLPKDICADATLSNLELQGCFLDWDSPLLRGLKCLRITSNSSTITAAFQATSISELLNALGAMPDLEILQMNECLPSDESPPSHKTIAFPLLRHLTLSNRHGLGAFRDFAYILQSLIIPFSAVVDLKCNPPNVPSDDDVQWTLFISSLNAFFGSMIDVGGVLSYSTFCLRTHISWADIRVEAWRDSWTHSTTIQRPPPHCSLKFCTPSFLEKVVTSLPLSRLKTLLLSLSFSPTSIFLIECFGQLPHLDSIVVNAEPLWEDNRANVLNNFFSALTYYDPPIESNCPSFLPFPHLKYLHMEQVDFTKNCKGSSVVDALRDCLKSRYEHGASLQKLTLSLSPGLLQKDLQLLKKVVANVEWEDGH